MTDNTQELDEIFCNAGLPHPGEDETSAQFKQILLDWHNKQIEKAMAKFSLKKGVKYDVKATDSVIVITPANKLKESSNDKDC